MKKIVNGICICLGFLSLALGIVGAVLPVLPTTPFLILSAALFAKSSERFHTWLLSTKLYQRYIGDAVHKKQMTKKAKRNLLVTLGIIFVRSIPTNKVGWDEETHFKRAYQMSIYPGGEKISTEISGQFTTDTLYNYPYFQPSSSWITLQPV